VIGSDRYHRAIATVAFASIGLAAGCSSVPSIDDASPAAAAPAVETGEAPSVTSATEPTAPPSLPTLDDLLAQDRFVALRVAFERSGLDIVLDGLDDFVLLAPTDAAFASSGADIGIEYPTLMNDPRLLEAILRYHVVADASTNQSWRTLNGAALAVDGSDADTVERFDGVDVVDRIPLANGTVFVMPRLLLPAPDSFVTGTAPQDDG
jgi:uncharacterized surface protein with fasciclin (FAS1) repeats